MSYYGNQVANPYGLDLDAHGNPLNTARNMDILDEIERQKMAAAPYYGGGFQAPSPQYGRHEQAYPRDNYYPEVLASRDSNRHVYREGVGAVPTNQGGSYYRENIRHENNDRFSYGNNGNVVPNRFMDEDTRSPEYPRANPESHQADNYRTAPVENKPAEPNRGVKEIKIPIPHNGIYHWTLLPKGLKEERIVTTSKVLSEGYKMIGNEKIKIVNIGDYYASSIIKIEEDAMSAIEDRFSEELFNSHPDSAKAIKRIEIINIKNDLKNAVTSFSNNHLVNRLLQEISKTPNFEKDKAYTFDYINATRYYSNKSVNLFIKAADEVNSFSDGAKALVDIFDKYAENETNINSLLTIDNELTRDFLTFIRGFTGNEAIKLNSFMNSVGKLYLAADSYVDVTAQRNIKTGIERFTNMLFINIKKIKEDLEDLSGIYVPRKELSIITKDSRIRGELSSLQERNESRFYLVDEGFTPELSRLIEDVDARKIISGYTKITLYTIDGLYQIVKTKGKGYYVALVDIYKI